MLSLWMATGLGILLVSTVGVILLEQLKVLQRLETLTEQNRLILEEALAIRKPPSKPFVSLTQRRTPF